MTNAIRQTTDQRGPCGLRRGVKDIAGVDDEQLAQMVQADHVTLPHVKVVVSIPSKHGDTPNQLKAQAAERALSAIHSHDEPLNLAHEVMPVDALKVIVQHHHHVVPISADLHGLFIRDQKNVRRDAVGRVDEVVYQKALKVSVVCLAPSPSLVAPELGWAGGTLAVLARLLALVKGADGADAGVVGLLVVLEWEAVKGKRAELLDHAGTHGVCRARPIVVGRLDRQRGRVGHVGENGRFAIGSTDVRR